GVDVKVPGVSVTAGDGAGTEVKVPGISVSVPAGSGSPVTVTAGEKAGTANPGTVPLDFAVPAEARSVAVKLALPAGSLSLDRAGTNAVTGQVGYVRTTPLITTSLSGGQFTVDIPRESQSVNVGGAKIPDTVLRLGTDLPANLDLQVYLGDATLDLQALHVSSLKAVVLMGNMTVKFPAGANVRLTAKQAMGTNNLAAAGFVKQGDAWLSPSFRNENVIEAELQLNMGSLTVAR
ncbi:MAG: hypothetical protein K0R39_4092, partial [Symbiobacteriaceae bacterium]|nr:hypothetical protein [Symbiobacteriaceae bacterium]